MHIFLADMTPSILVTTAAVSICIRRFFGLKETLGSTKSFYFYPALERQRNKLLYTTTYTSSSCQMAYVVVMERTYTFIDL